jgi:hypothetical protein
MAVCTQGLHAHRRAAARTAEACVDASWWLLVPILLRLFNTTRTTSGTPSTGAAISYGLCWTWTIRSRMDGSETRECLTRRVDPTGV